MWNDPDPVSSMLNSSSQFTSMQFSLNYSGCLKNFRSGDSTSKKETLRRQQLLNGFSADATSRTLASPSSPSPSSRSRSLSFRSSSPSSMLRPVSASSSRRSRPLSAMSRDSTLSQSRVSHLSYGVPAFPVSAESGYVRSMSRPSSTLNHDHPISPSPTMGYAHGESVRRRTDELKLELSALWQDQVRAFDRVDSSTNYRNHIDPSISSLRNEEERGDHMSSEPDTPTSRTGRSISRRLSISFHDRAKSGVESPSYMDTFAKTLFPSIEERAEIIHDDEMRSQSRLTCGLDDDELLDALSFGGTSRAGSRVALPSRIGSKSISLEPFSLSTPEELRDLIITKSDFFFITKLSLHRGGGLFQHTHLRWISDYCMYLTNLDLQGCTNLSDETLVKIIRNISSTLERLNVSKCRCLTDDGIRNALKHSPNLLSLSIAWLPLLTGRRCFKYVCECSVLEKLDLSHNESLCSDGFIELFSSSNSIRSLNLSYCPQLDAHAFGVLVERMRSLEVLMLRMSENILYDHAPASTLQRSFEKFQYTSNLLDRLLQLERPKTQADWLLERESKNSAKSSFDDVSSSHLGGNPDTFAEDTSVGISSLIQAINSELDAPLPRAQANSPRDDDFVRGSADVLNRWRQEDIDFSSPSLQTSPLEQLGKRLDSLFVLDLTGISAIPVQALTQIIRSCFRLQRLSIGDVQSMNDDLAGSIVRNCPDLIWLEVNSCSQLTAAGVGLLIEGLRSLRRLEISNTGVTAEDIPRLALKNLSCDLVFHRCPTAAPRVIARQKVKEKASKGKKKGKGAGKKGGKKKKK